MPFQEQGIFKNYHPLNHSAKMEMMVGGGDDELWLKCIMRLLDLMLIEWIVLKYTWNKR